MAKTAVADNRDKVTEDLLNEHNIKFEYVQIVPLEQIEKHPDSQSRLSNTPEARVRTYAESMRQGTVFPPVVLWNDPTNGYSIVDGNTRVAAKGKRGETHTDAYLIDLTSRSQAVVVSAIFNGHNGQPLTPQEVKRAVLANMDLKPGLTPARLAKNYGVAPSVVSRYVNTAKAATELGGLGVDVDKMTESAVQAVGSLNEAAVKRDLAALVIDADLPQTEIRTLVNAAKGLESETARLKHIAEVRQDYNTVIVARRAGQVTQGIPVTQAAMAYGRLVALIKDFPNPADWVPSNAARRVEHLDRTTKICDFLTQVREEIVKASLPQETPSA